MKRWLLTLCLVGSCWAQGHVLAPVNGGTGDNTLLQYGILVGEGLSPVNLVTPGADSVPLWQTAVSDPVATAIPLCVDSGGQHLNYDTTAHTFSCGTSSSGTTYSGIAPIAVTGANISIQNATPVNVTSAYGFGTGFAALSTAGVVSGNLVIGDANTGIMDSGELNLSVANHVLQNASDTQTWTVRGGGNGSHNAAIGALHLVGGNQTGVGGASSKGGEIQIRGGNNAGTNAASQAGWVYVEPGSSTAGGFQGGLLLHHVYLKGGGTSTQWYMQCLTATQMKVNDCGASPQNWLGIAHDVSGTTVNVHVPPSESPVSASAPVTLGHTVCLGAASPQVTDSGGTSSCTSAQGVTVGVVIAISGGPVDIGDGTAVTFSTTLPLISMNTSVVGGTGGTVTSVTGVAPVASTGGTTPAISLQNSAAANITAALGTDTEYFTASGSAATANHIIEGDAQGGITDSGIVDTHVVNAATFPLSISGHTVSLSTAPAQGGGILGTHFKCVSAITNRAPFSVVASLRGFLPDDAFFSNLVVSVCASSVPSQTYLYFKKLVNQAGTTDSSDQARMSIAKDAGAAVYHEAAGSYPYHVPAWETFAVATDRLNNSIGTLASIAGISWEVGGSQPFAANPNSVTIAGSTAKILGPSNENYLATGSEAQAIMPVPGAGTVTSTCVFTNGQPAGGTLTVTLRLTPIATGVTASTSQVATVPANTGQSDIECDYAHPITIAAGDGIDWLLTNNSVSATAAIYYVVSEVQFSDGTTAAIPWSNVNTVSYFAPWITASNGTAIQMEGPFPRAVTATSAYCYVYSNPLTANETATIVKNGSDDAITFTIPTTGCTNNVCFDTSHTISYAQWDLFTLHTTQTAGTPSTMNCSLGVQ